VIISFGLGDITDMFILFYFFIINFYSYKFHSATYRAAYSDSYDNSCNNGDDGCNTCDDNRCI